MGISGAQQLSKFPETLKVSLKILSREICFFLNGRVGCIDLSIIFARQSFRPLDLCLNIQEITLELGFLYF